GGRAGGKQTLRLEARGAALPSGSPPGMGQRRTPRCWGARRRIAESDAAAAETASLVPGALRLELPAVRGSSLQRGGFPAPGAILLRSRPGNGQRPHSANPPPESPAARTGQVDRPGHRLHHARPPSSPPLPRRLVLRATSKGLSLDPKVPMPGSTDPRNLTPKAGIWQPAGFRSTSDTATAGAATPTYSDRPREACRPPAPRQTHLSLID